MHRLLLKCTILKCSSAHLAETFFALYACRLLMCLINYLWHKSRRRFCTLIFEFWWNSRSSYCFQFRKIMSSQIPRWRIAWSQLRCCELLYVTLLHSCFDCLPRCNSTTNRTLVFRLTSCNLKALNSIRIITFDCVFATDVEGMP